MANRDGSGSRGPIALLLNLSWPVFALQARRPVPVERRKMLTTSSDAP
jgi:hypothetical protein